MATIYEFPKTRWVRTPAMVAEREAYQEKFRQQQAELQNRKAAQSALPEETPDYAGMLSAESEFPNTFTGTITGGRHAAKRRRIIPDGMVMDDLIGPFGKVSAIVISDAGVTEFFDGGDAA